MTQVLIASVMKRVVVVVVDITVLLKQEVNAKSLTRRNNFGHNTRSLSILIKMALIFIQKSTRVFLIMSSYF